ncbi:uncharacterized protein LOC120447143 isoform X1 [Drosophila santomea]|uniref:uncharacterized protein LOC120447143 isoform X1 n=1 Tax=Drosophila santomea TaxID=129105 RepID=UPI00195323A9|nr:uncharacterized protein LOC120447143 isoform X1 [Drosophila santomea]
MAEKGSQENTEAIVKGNTKSSEELGLPEALEDLMELDLEAHGVGGLKSKDKDKSMDLDIYDDLYEMEPAGSTKSKEVDRSLELDIYDDLDDFQKVEDRKTKELQEWEAKYEKALAEIVALKAENKALGKKIKTMEVNLQNLLDTAKAEIKRKETLISELRNEKDDVCFRRKRARPFELPGVSEPESKRTKEFQAKPIDAKTDMETDRNPFKAAKDGAKKFTATEDARKMMTTKDDTKKFTAKEDVRKMMTTKDDTKKIALKDVESAAIFKDDNKKPILKDNDQKWFSKDHATKSITREDDKKSVQRSKFPRPEYSKTTDRKSTTQTRRPENRHRSRDRHHSRSRSPKHSSRRDYHRSQESKSRHAKRRSHSASPSKIHLSRESTKANTTLTGNEANDQRSRSPILESTKLVYESQPPRKGVSKRRDAASETNANSSSEPKVQTKDITQPKDGLISEACIPKHDIIPGLNLINPESEDVFNNEIELDKRDEKNPFKKFSNHTKDTHAHDLLNKTSNQKVVIVEKCKNISAKDCPADAQQLDQLKDAREANEPQAKLDKKEPFAVETVVETANNEEGTDYVALSKNMTPLTDVCSQHDENEKAGSRKEIREPNITDEVSSVVKSDVGVRIIEDIRLPKMANIDHFAVKVDQQDEAPTAVTNSAPNQQNLATQDKNIGCAEIKDQTAFSSADETPIKSTVLYAKPDSTKLDHSDEHDEVILEAEMDMLTNDQDAASTADPTYPNMRIAEDAIEMALEQLHQQSPDETVVTSTSNRAPQTPKQSLITILTQSPSQRGPIKSQTKSKTVSSMPTPKKQATEKTPLKKRKVNMDSAPQVPAASLDDTIDETLGASLHDDGSTVTKRCSLGHTDYQYEQIKDEVILRVKRRARRRKPIPTEIPTAAADKPI